MIVKNYYHACQYHARVFSKWQSRHLPSRISVPMTIRQKPGGEILSSMDIPFRFCNDPSARERRGLGIYVLGYMAILTGLLYALNRTTWQGIKKKP